MGEGLCHCADMPRRYTALLTLALSSAFPVLVSIFVFMTLSVTAAILISLFVMGSQMFFAYVVLDRMLTEIAKEIRTLS